MSFKRFFMNPFGRKPKPKEPEPAPVQSVEDICSAIDNLALAEEKSAGAACGTKEEDKSQERKLIVAPHDDNRNGSTSSGDEKNDSAKVKRSVAPAELNDGQLVDEYRVKLYRFDDWVWKERGVGMLGIYRSKLPKGDYRVAMWIEHTGRLVCNFRLFPGFQVRVDEKNGNKAFWVCEDCLHPGCSNWETFAGRFASEDKCKDFKDKINLYSNSNGNSESTSPEPEESIESGIGISDDSVNCLGCIGCDPDKFEFPLHAQHLKNTEDPIDSPLDACSCSDTPFPVKPALFSLVS